MSGTNIISTAAFYIIFKELLNFVNNSVLDTVNPSNVASECSSGHGPFATDHSHFELLPILDCLLMVENLNEEFVVLVFVVLLVEVVVVDSHLVVSQALIPLEGTKKTMNNEVTTYKVFLRIKEFKFSAQLNVESDDCQIRQIRPLGNLSLGQKAKTVLCICDLKGISSGRMMTFFTCSKTATSQTKIPDIEDMLLSSRAKETAYGKIIQLGVGKHIRRNQPHKACTTDPFEKKRLLIRPYPILEGFIYENIDKKNRLTDIDEYTSSGSGNPVKKILLKLNLSDHRSILTDPKCRSVKVKEFQERCNIKAFQERYEHVGPEVASSQDGKVSRWQRDCAWLMISRCSRSQCQIQVQGTSSIQEVNDHYNIFTRESQECELKTKDKA
ncbi:hypothetical protein Tco_1018850 [Tanacetum coccineum]|uniref:Uncharacterized protein n=1 Tax=Tanacetum coccineum TaxID=301880 RepID=A0ABQ5FVI5_9ASTR